MKSLRILVVDDHEMVRRGLKDALTERPGWEICGEATDGRQAVTQAEQLQPDVVIMDITMPELNGLEAIHRIRRSSPRTEVLVLTMHDSEQLMREVLAAGARGYVLKNDAGRVLVQAVEALSAHQPFFSSRVTDAVPDARLRSQGHRAPGPSRRPGPLTSREREVLQLIAEGKSNKEVASALGISVRTAETHRTKIMRKLDLRSASDITRYAIRNNIIQA